MSRPRTLLTPPAPPVLETVNGMGVSARQLQRLADTLRDMYGGNHDWREDARRVLAAV